MATLYAKAAGGNWSAAGTWSTTGSGGGDSSGPPTAADDVIFETSSGNVTIDSAAVCRSLDCTSGTGDYGGTLTHNAAVGLSIGDGTAGAGSVALKFVSGMTYTLGSATTSSIAFVSTSATQQTIATGTKTLGNWSINGSGSSYLFSDANTSSGTVTLTLGTIDTGSFAWSMVAFANGASGTRVLTMGSSAVSLTGAGLVWNVTVNAGFTLTATTATITMSGSNAQFGPSTGSDWSGVNLVWTGAGSARTSAGTIASATRTGTSVKTDSLFLDASLVITGALTITGQSTINRVLFVSGTTGVARTVTPGSVSLTNVDIQDITASGTTWTGTSLGDALGNSNITFDTPVTQTHTASAGGNWSDVTKWTSRVPLPQDSVVVDSNTTGTITADMPRMGNDIDFTGFVGTAAFSSTPNTIYGSITLGSGMTVSGTQALTLSARSSKTLTSNGIQYTQAITITQVGGTYTQADAFSSASTVTQTGASTYTSNGFAFTALTFAAGAGSVTNMGASTWSVTGTSSIVFSHGGTLNAGTSNLVISTASASGRTIAIGVGRALATLTYTVAGSTGSLTMATALITIGTLNFSDASNARSLILPASTTTTITSAFNVQGTAGNLMSVISNSSGTAATLVKTSGVVSCDYLSLKDSAATGGASWYAGANSTLVSNVTGWIFTAPTNAMFFPFIQTM